MSSLSNLCTFCFTEQVGHLFRIKKRVSNDEMTAICRVCAERRTRGGELTLNFKPTQHGFYLPKLSQFIVIAATLAPLKNDVTATVGWRCSIVVSLVTPSVLPNSKQN